MQGVAQKKRMPYKRPMSRTEASIAAEKRYRSRHETIQLRFDKEDPFDQALLKAIDTHRGNLRRGEWARIIGKAMLRRAMGLPEPSGDKDVL